MMKQITNLQLSEIMESNVNSVDSNCKVLELIEIIKQQPVSVIVVLENSTPVGIFTERDLIRLLHNKSIKDQPVKEIMSKPVTSVPAVLNFRSAYVQLCLNRLRHIIVVDESGDVIGVAAERNFLGYMGLELFKSVSTMMNLIDKSVPQLDNTTTVTGAVDQMIESKRGCVISHNENRLGIFTEHMAPGILAQQQNLNKLTLGEVMSYSEPITLKTHISDVINQLVNEKIGYVIVTSPEGKIIGSISQSSLLESVRAAVYGEIATRQLVEDELLRLEAQMEATLEQTPNVAVQWYDQEGGIHYWNHASEALYGWKAKESIGKNIEVMLPNKIESVEFKNILIDINNSGKTVGPREFIKHDRYGNSHWVESTIFPIPGETTNESFFVCMDVDITKRHQVEDQMIKYQSDLENLVNKKTRQLCMEKQHAEEASKTKSAFLAHMSHEIRTPMNGIIGMTELALNTGLSEKQKNYISKANISAKNLLGILNDILDYSKIEAGKLELEITNFSLTDTIRNTLNLIKLKAQESAIEISINIDKEVPRSLKGDPLRLGQILLNLLSNAIKFSHTDATVSLNIKVRQKKAQDIVLHFSISDSGIGMNPEQQHNIFNSFTQADDSTSRLYGGTGLGLSICQQLTELMGGKIWCESKENEGSIFHFTMRVKTQSDEEKLSLLTEDTILDYSTAKKQLQNAKILLVEDNKINEELARELLIMNGMTVISAANGKIALQALTENDVDGVLMDCQMPIMDGYQATQEIRKLERLKELPVIAMTANVMKKDIEKVLSVGMNDHIAKPLNPETMLITMSKWIKKL